MENRITLKEYEDMKAARKAARLREDWDAYDELTERLEGAYKRLLPEVGMACTEYLWSDHYGATIVEVCTPDKVGIRHNCFKVINRDGDCETTDELEGDVLYYSRRKNNGWYQVGQKAGFGSCQLALGYRSTYRDPSF